MINEVGDPGKVEESGEIDGLINLGRQQFEFD